MRIISGTLKGKILHPPAGLPVRPTTDFAKTGLFNILNNRYSMETLHVLDLFAGTGSIAFEFLSRGAATVECVDADARCVRYIRQTAQQFNFQNCIVHHQQVRSFLEHGSRRFTIVFADPPFDSTEYDALIDAITGSGIVATEGCFILEHQRKKSFSGHPRFMEQRHYGNVAFTFFTTLRSAKKIPGT